MGLNAAYLTWCRDFKLVRLQEPDRGTYPWNAHHNLLQYIHNHLQCICNHWKKCSRASPAWQDDKEDVRWAYRQRDNKQSAHKLLQHDRMIKKRGEHIDTDIINRELTAICNHKGSAHEFLPYSSTPVHHESSAPQASPPAHLDRWRRSEHVHTENSTYLCHQLPTFHLANEPQMPIMLIVDSSSVVEVQAPSHLHFECWGRHLRACCYC